MSEDEKNKMTEYSIDEINDTDKKEFVETFGNIYEESPWVAMQAFSAKPFDSVSDIVATFAEIVDTASQEKQVELLRAHPDLGEQTEMTDASKQEQASAGLDQLSEEQYKAFQRLNKRYKTQFEFPFIMAVQDESPASIKEAMEQRVEHDRKKEFNRALSEVHDIARLRLQDVVVE
jgi:2-oxo-4-hydroxy-4-carboxy-5-ureidoimidazoline decarboxylase